MKDEPNKAKRPGKVKRVPYHEWVERDGPRKKVRMEMRTCQHADGRSVSVGKLPNANGVKVVLKGPVIDGEGSHLELSLSAWAVAALVVLLQQAAPKLDFSEVVS